MEGKVAIVGLITAAALVACGAVASPSSSPRPSPKPTQHADSLSDIRALYQSDSAALNSDATAFGIEMRQGVHDQDGWTIFGAFHGFWGALTGFDSSVRALRFPASLQVKETDMLNADSALEKDLLDAAATKSPRDWAAQWDLDIVRAQTAHDSLTQALGLPDDAFLVTIRSTA